MKLSTSIITLTSLFLANIITLPHSLAYSFNLNDLDATQNLVKAGDKYVTLLGQQVQIGQQAPTFKVVDKNFSPVSLKDFAKQTLLISVVPSLDTGVCSLQTKRFNEEANKLPKNISIITISNDLPFAQKRFCKTENVDEVKVLSDSVWRDFGASYGLIIKDMGLLTRAIFIIDDSGKIAYKELVTNISQHPDYDKALVAVQNIAPVIVSEDNTEDDFTQEEGQEE
jgi:thiol peroxidase